MTRLDVHDRKVFRAGGVIYAEGEAGDCVYIVQSGAVELVRSTDDGPLVIARVGPGGLFGEKSLIDGRPRSATALAAQDTVCVVVPHSAFADKLRRTDPFVRMLLNLIVADFRRALTKDPDDTGGRGATGGP
ncbi:MAG: cyclic nucleotide-binding domain-containing protein [Proteobacteria bacterium]|nr:cyclic nucleotide-binding domain-containing protein [Pseudomonadota bacterium]